MALAQLNQNGQQPSPRRDSVADESLSGAEERVMLEGQKAYIVVNAIGAVVLLVFLQAIWSNPGALLLKKGVLWGVVAFGAGVAIATLGYALRLWSLRRSGPRFIAPVVSLVNGAVPLLVVGSFLAGVILPVKGGFESLPPSPADRTAQVKDAPRGDAGKGDVNRRR
jgi:hypothetical protein